MKYPLCTVLLPVFNGEKYLKEAIDSILCQTYNNFELLIINDGSTDLTDKIIRSYTDPRIRYVVNKQNLSLVKTLNKGIRLSKGKYIARMDADDLSHPQRLEKQIAFLEKNPEYGLIGSLFGIINQNREILEVGGAKLLEHEDLKLGMLFANIFCHGETMFRKKLCTEHNLFYDETYAYAEDYELWTRMILHTKIKNLPEVLYFYMSNPDGIMARKQGIHDEYVRKIVTKYRSEVGFPKLTGSYILSLVKNGRLYKDGYLDVNGTPIFAYHQLAYQVYLYRLAYVYLRDKRVDGVGLFAASFLINPLNWIKHLLGTFPKPEDKKIEKQ